MAAAKGVGRLASLYGTIERIRSAEARAASYALDEITCATAIAAASRNSQLLFAREAMASGQREEWQVAETTRSLVELQIERLKVLQAESKALHEVAMASHQLSQLQKEQINSVLERDHAKSSLLTARSAQAEADDRFASRLAWGRSRVTSSDT